MAVLPILLFLQVLEGILSQEPFFSVCQGLHYPGSTSTIRGAPEARWGPGSPKTSASPLWEATQAPCAVRGMSPLKTCFRAVLSPLSL